MSNEQKKRTVLANTKKYCHLNDSDLFLRIINAIASAKMSGDIVREFDISLTDLRMIKSSQEYWDFKEAYFSDVREAVDYSSLEQLKLFSKFDSQILSELKDMAFNCDKPAFRLQAMKLWLTHSGISRGQLQSLEYQELKALVEEMAGEASFDSLANQNDGGEDAN
ncbi:MAG: hypothetical protein AB4368_23570 [Xenococcaceae cyanobacterium]